PGRPPAPSIEPAEPISEAPRKVVAPEAPRKVVVAARAAPLPRISPTLSVGYTTPLTAADPLGPAPLSGPVNGGPGFKLASGLRCRLGGIDHCDGEFAIYPALAATIDFEWAKPYNAVSLTAR